MIPQESGGERVERDLGKEESWGARLALSFQPTDNLRITPSVFRQETKVDGSSLWEGAFRDLTAYDRKVNDRQTNAFTLTGLEASWTLGNIEYSPPPTSRPISARWKTAPRVASTPG